MGILLIVAFVGIALFTVAHAYRRQDPTGALPWM